MLNIRHVTITKANCHALILQELTKRGGIIVGKEKVQTRTE